VVDALAAMQHLPAVHVLHAHYNIARVAHESSVEGDNIRRVAFVHDLQLAHNPLSNLLLGFDVDNLFASISGALPLTVKLLTFRAMTTLVAACCTLLTVPPLPAPSSFMTTRSSDRKSRRNSTPISSVSPRSLFPRAPGTCASPGDGETALGAGAFRAKPLMFFRFIVFVLKESAILTICSCVVALVARGMRVEEANLVVRGRFVRGLGVITL
jgi:hypothetical protein